MRSILLLPLLLLLSACAPSQPVEPAVLYGAVTVGPLSPVEIEGQTPPPVNPEVYTSRSLNIFRANGETLVANVPFQADGTYRVELPPGTYVVALAPLGVDYSKDLPQTLTLEAGASVELNIDIDTGIR